MLIKIVSIIIISIIARCGLGFWGIRSLGWQGIEKEVYILLFLFIVIGIVFLITSLQGEKDEFVKSSQIKVKNKNNRLPNKADAPETRA